MSRQSEHRNWPGLNASLKRAYDALDDGDTIRANDIALVALKVAARDRDLPVEGEALVLLAHCDRVGNPDLRRASESSRRAAQIFGQLGDALGEARALTTLSHVTLLLGRNDEAVEAALMAVRLCGDAPSPSAVLAHNVLGLAYSWIGDNDRADVSLDLSVDIGSRCDPSVSPFQPRLNQLWVEASRQHTYRFEHGRLGNLERLKRIADECELLVFNGKDRAVMPGIRRMGGTIFEVSLAVVAAWTGRLQDAEDHIDAASRTLPLHQSWLQSFVHWCRAELAWTRNDLAEAEKSLVLMRDTALAVDHEQMACRAQLLLIQVLRLQGQLDRALSEHHSLRWREARMVGEALRSRESLVTWQLDARVRERAMREVRNVSDQALLADKAKTRFLAAASHDLRQPLYSLGVLVAALTLRDLDPGSRQIVSLLDKVNQTMSKQLDALLDISKLDAGVITPTRTFERLDQLLQSSHEVLVPVAQDLGLDLLLDVEPDVVAWTDASLLSRLIGNLTDNALKFTPPGGTVTLAVRRKDGRAYLRISDTGVGIPPSEAERVFDEFYQVGNPGRDRSRGLGLGLSIVRRLAQLLDIKVTMTSGVGAGTEVSLELDALTVTQCPQTIGEMPQGPDRFMSVVLVVEDDALVRESVRLLLCQLGCTVHVASGTSQAVELAQRTRIDLVLSDYHLGAGEPGTVVIQRVLEIQPRAYGALVTGDLSVDRIRDAQRIDVPLLRKPVSLTDLIGILRAEAGASAQTELA